MDIPTISHEVSRIFADMYVLHGILIISSVHAIIFPYSQLNPNEQALDELEVPICSNLSTLNIPVASPSSHQVTILQGRLSNHDSGHLMAG